MKELGCKSGGHEYVQPQRGRQLHFEASKLTNPNSPEAVHRLPRSFFRDGRHAELLDLPSQFNEALASWLGSASSAGGAAADVGTQRVLRSLHWLHELRLQRYQAAAESILRAAEAPQVLAVAQVSGLVP